MTRTPGQAILAAPMGVVRLMDLLGDAHEVIRNEAVLLLTGLTRASADIQKIAAFEGAFDRILQILGCALHAGHTLRAGHVPCACGRQQATACAHAAAGRRAGRREASSCRTAWSS